MKRNSDDTASTTSMEAPKAKKPRTQRYTVPEENTVVVLLHNVPKEVGESIIGQIHEKEFQDEYAKKDKNIVPRGEIVTSKFVRLYPNEKQRKVIEKEYRRNYLQKPSAQAKINSPEKKKKLAEYNSQPEVKLRKQERAKQTRKFTQMMKEQHAEAYNQLMATLPKIKTTKSARKNGSKSSDQTDSTETKSSSTSDSSNSSTESSGGIQQGEQSQPFYPRE